MIGWPHLSAALILLLLTALPLRTRAIFDANYMCSLIANGTTIKDPRSCNTWIQCVDGTPITGTCSGDLFYDRSTKGCVPPLSIKCIASNPCAATEGVNGFVADPYSCNGYYYCSNGNAAHGQCSDGMNFNLGTQNCIRNLPCLTQMDPDSYCNIVPDGVFIRDVSKCNGWQMCWHGKVVQGKCPESYVFNAFKGLCDYPKDVKCVTTELQPNTPGLGTCTRVGEFISNNRSCNGYFYCHASTTGGGIVLVPGTCPVGRFFRSAGGGACVPRTQIACPFDRCVDMGLQNIQLANGSDDDCTGYVVCQRGLEIGAGTCPGGEFFNEVTQFCTTDRISYPACVLSGAVTATQLD